ncbi:MAG: hypothetical protein WC444_04600 [Candidatus Paceibacterota bacterium]
MKSIDKAVQVIGQERRHSMPANIPSGWDQAWLAGFLKEIEAHYDSVQEFQRSIDAVLQELDSSDERLGVGAYLKSLMAAASKFEDALETAHNFLNVDPEHTGIPID